MSRRKNIVQDYSYGGNVHVCSVDPMVDAMLSDMRRIGDRELLFTPLARCVNIMDRRSVFEDWLKVLGKGFLRFREEDSERRDKSKGVYRYDGRLWSPVNSVLLKDALKAYLTRDLAMNSNEWFRGESRFLEALYDGARLSPLNESRTMVAFVNGVFDFSEISHPVYYPFGGGEPVVSSLPYSYDVKADCPLWKSFLCQVLDSEQRLLLQKYMSLGLVDRYDAPFKIEKCLWMVGPGGAGKSTIQNVISHVYGEGRVSSLSLGQLLSGGNDERSRYVALMDGKIFNFCKEVQMEDITYRVDSFKSLCSGEPQQMRKIGGDVHEMREVPYLVFNMNRKPRSRNIDNALMRRILFLSFRSPKREEDFDLELESKLKKEAAGIRNWLIEGFVKLRSDGFRFDNPQSEVTESDEWFVQNGLTGELFLRKMDCRYYSYSGEKEQGRWFPLKVIYGFYLEWCRKWGYDEDLDITGFGRLLRGMGFLSKRQSQGMSYRVYGGDKLV